MDWKLGGLTTAAVLVLAATPGPAPAADMAGWLSERSAMQFQVWGRRWLPAQNVTVGADFICMEIELADPLETKFRPRCFPFSSIYSFSEQGGTVSLTLVRDP